MARGAFAEISGKRHDQTYFSDGLPSRPDPDNAGAGKQVSRCSMYLSPPNILKEVFYVIF